MDVHAKPRILICTQSPEVVRELNDLLKNGFTQTVVRGNFEVAEVLRSTPHMALISELPTPTTLDETESRQALLDFLEATRRSFANVRRVVVTDHCDLSLVINGLHTGAIDSLVYRPLTFHDLISALRPGAGRTQQPPTAPMNAKAVAHTHVFRPQPLGR